MFKIVLLGFLVFTVSYVVVPTQTYAISLDDEEEDAEDVADLLEEAKRAGANESFSKADELLKKAKMYGVSGSDVQETERYVAQKKRAREERLERERKERERVAQLKREREERSRQARMQQSSYSRSSRVDYVMVNFESICGFVGCSDKNLQISGGPGHFSPSYSGAHSGAIHKGYNGALAGQYHWSAQFDNEFCSGTFYVSGQKSNITLNIHKGCSSFNVHEY